MFTRVLAAAVLVVAFLAPGAVAQQWSAEQQEVWGEIMKAWKTWISGDVDANYELVHPDFVFWNSENSVPGDRATAYSLDSAFHGAVGTKWYGATVTPLTILVEGDVAIVHTYFRAFQEQGGSAPTWVTERWMEVYKKEGDKWMLLANYGDFN